MVNNEAIYALYIIPENIRCGADRLRTVTNDESQNDEALTLIDWQSI